MTPPPCQHSLGSPLKLRSSELRDGLPPPCTFSSLHPLSTLKQLKEMDLSLTACSATSLYGLAELSSLELLRLDAPMLKSLAGLSTELTTLEVARSSQLPSLVGIEHLQGLQRLAIPSSGVTSLHQLAGLGSLSDLSINGTFSSLTSLGGNLCMCLQTLRLNSCLQLRQLSGLEGLTALQKLCIDDCELISLQPVGQLAGGLTELYVCECMIVQDEVVELPHMQPTAVVAIHRSNVKALVLAGGVRAIVGIATQ